MAPDEFADELINQVLSTIANGNHKVLIWGITPPALKLLSFLNVSGLISKIAALVDGRSQLQTQRFFHLEVKSPRQLSDIEVDTLVICFDKEKESILEQFSEANSGKPHVVIAGNANYEFHDPIFDQIVKSCLVKSKAGGYPNMLVHLYQTLRHISIHKLDGHVAEFGVFQGGTTVFMAKVLRHFGYSGEIYGFDTFQGFPPRKSIFDLYDDSKCEFQDYESVRSYCEPYNIKLIVGDISETYTKLKNVPLALTFFDTDNYSSITRALDLCADQTIRNGALAFDHYFSPGWIRTIGERIAIRRVLSEKSFFNLHGTGIFIKL
jgi:hypothetical protein